MKTLMDFLKKEYSHIFVDFDNTLYLWDNSPERKTIEPVEWYAHQLPRMGHIYKDKYINKLLVDYLQRSCAMIHLTTQVTFSFEAEAKFNFIDRFHPNLLADFIGTASTEDKVHLMEAYENLGITKSKMLMIDDNYNVVHECRKAGFDVQEPQFIMNVIYEDKLTGSGYL